MKKILLMGVAVSLVAFSANAWDASPYVSAKLMFADLDGELSINDTGKMDVNNNTWGGSIAAGIITPLCSGSAIRAELEYTNIAESDVHLFDGVKVRPSVEAYMFNLYYDFDMDSKFTPYIGAGIGSAKTKYKIKEGASASFIDRQLAWQAGFGVAYAATDHVSVDFGYRYADYGDFSKELYFQKIKFDTKANEIYLGLRYSF